MSFCYRFLITLDSFVRELARLMVPGSEVELNEFKSNIVAKVRFKTTIFCRITPRSMPSYIRWARKLALREEKPAKLRFGDSFRMRLLLSWRLTFWVLTFLINHQLNFEMVFLSSSDFRFQLLLSLMNF
jgi:hypothetical protein